MAADGITGSVTPPGGSPIEPGKIAPQKQVAPQATPIPVSLGGSPRIPKRPIASLPHPREGGSPLKAEAPKLAADVAKANRLRAIPGLVRFMAENPSPDGDIRKNTLYPQFVKLFQTLEPKDAATVTKALEECAKDPKLQEVVKQLEAIYKVSEELFDFVSKSNSADDISQKILEMLPTCDHSFVVMDWVEARLKRLERPFLAAFHPVRIFIATCQEMQAFVLKNDLKGLIKFYNSIAKTDEGHAQKIIDVIKCNVPFNIFLELFTNVADVNKKVEEQLTLLRDGALVQVEANMRAFGLMSNEFKETVMACLEMDIEAEDADKLETLKTALQENETLFVKRALAVRVPFDAIVKAMPENSAVRILYNKIKEASESQEFEGSQALRMTKRDCLLMALFIATTVQPTQDVAKRYFPAQKDVQVPLDQRLARDVQFDWSKKEVYVIADPDSAALKAAGTYKKVRSSAAIQLERPASPVEHVVQITPVAAAPDAEQIAEITNEMPVMEALQGIPGIPKVRSIIDLTHQPGATLKAGVSVIMKKAEKGDLADRIKKGDLKVVGDAVPPALLNISKQILTTYSGVHTRGYIHGDTKPGNILIGKDDEVMVTDFGFTYSTRPANGMMAAKDVTTEQNTYAAWWSTPFEQLDETLAIMQRQLRFEDRAITNDVAPKPGETVADMKKRVDAVAKEHELQESYVVGTILYEMAYGKTAWMQTLMNKGWPPSAHLTRATLDVMKEEYATAVREKLEHLNDNVDVADRTDAEHYQFAVLKLMDVKASRWTVAEALAYLQANIIPEPEILPLPPMPPGQPIGGAPLD